jgi:hydrogenase-4 component E
VQALALALIAFAESEDAADAAAAIALTARSLLLAGLFLLVVARTRESHPVRARVSPFVRAGAAIGLALTLIWLVPPIGLDSGQVERAVLALVAFGTVVVATRRATLHQLLGIVLVENALVLAALALPGGAQLAIEVGVAIDLVLIGLVALVFHERIFAEFGAGSTSALESLRD